MLFFSFPYIFSFRQFCTSFRYCLVQRTHSFFSIFLCFSSILIDWFFLFLFFLSFWWTPLTQDNRSFAWKTLLLSHPKARLEISILGQGYGKKSMFGSKGLQMVGHNVCRDICLAKWLRKMGMPKSFPWNTYYDNYKFMKN